MEPACTPTQARSQVVAGGVLPLGRQPVLEGMPDRPVRRSPSHRVRGINDHDAGMAPVMRELARHEQRRRRLAPGGQTAPCSGLAERGRSQPLGAIARRYRSPPSGRQPPAGARYARWSGARAARAARATAPGAAGRCHLERRHRAPMQRIRWHRPRCCPGPTGTRPSCGSGSWNPRSSQDLAAIPKAWRPGWSSRQPVRWLRRAGQSYCTAFSAARRCATSRLPTPRSAAIAAKLVPRGFAFPCSQA